MNQAITSSSATASEEEAAAHVQELLQSIIAAPSDDEPRLVYADYLETQGDTRGELIQVQCLLARIGPDDPRRPALLLREAELDRAHAKDWLADLWALALPSTRFEFQRGFVETIATPFASITMHAQSLLARAPLLSTLKLSVDGQTDRVELARPRNISVLVRARELSIEGRHKGNTRDGQGPIGDLNGLAAIAFTNLRSLRLVRLRTRPADLASLLGSPHLAKLEELVLQLSLDANTIMTMLAKPVACMSLQKIDLARNRIGDEGVTLLARSGLLESVTDLDLTANGITDLGLAELLEGNRLRSIERLALSSNYGLGDAALHRLAAWPGGTKLRKLVMTNAGAVTAVGREALFASPQRSALRSVTIDD